MTREDAEIRVRDLELKREKLVDQLLEIDASSASVSAGGSSKSVTNRSITELKKKISYCDKEIDRLKFRLGKGKNPDAITGVYPRYR